MGSGAQIFIVMVFVTVVLLMQGLVVPVFGESAKVRKRLKKRIADIETTGDADAFSSLLREKYLRRLSPLERRLESFAAMEALARQIEQAGHKILAYRLVLISVAIGVAVLLASWSYFRMPVATISTALLAAYLPFMKIKMDRTKRTKMFEEQLPDAIDTMKRALKAGHPLSASIKLVAEEMDDPVAAEFELTFGDINYGNDVRKAMLGLLARVPSVTVMALVTSILVQKETGGNLAEILENSTGPQGTDLFGGRPNVSMGTGNGAVSAVCNIMVHDARISSCTARRPARPENDYLRILLRRSRNILDPQNHTD